ncbi:MAG: hypothetical protein ACK42E_04940 [Candidatus Bipolaricaulaceae bacterium]
MRLILVWATAAVVACAGEWGLRLESPRDTWGWVSQTWDLAGLTTSIRGEAQLIPFAFRRLALHASGTGTWSTWKLEGAWLSSGRMDLFLSASLSRGFALGQTTVQLAAGGRCGWAALNVSPLWVSTFWALAEVEGPRGKGRVQWDGPPSVWTLRLEIPNLTLSLGRAVVLELWQTQGDWTLSTQVQLAPAREQRLSATWTSAGRTTRAWLSLEGGGLLFSASQGEWALLFSLLWEEDMRGTLELTRAF